VAELPSNAEPASVVVIGDALIDELREGGLTSDHVGGAALNVAVGLSILGTSATLIAMVGNDDDGSAIRSVLEEYGVLLIDSPGSAGTSRAISDRAHGEPSYTFNAAARHRRIRFGDRERAAIENASLVAISCFPFDDQAQFDDLTACLADSDAAVVIDANPRSGMLRDGNLFATNLERLGSRSLMIKMSADDAHLLYGVRIEAAQQRLFSTGVDTILATSGHDGASVISSDGAYVHVPTSPIDRPIIDTMGAGDATFASVIHSLTVGGVPSDVDAWTKVLNTAMAIAAATCRHKGGQLRLPSHPQPGTVLA
jgi:sugar/nucleoside kinase (ribokinase family)